MYMYMLVVNTRLIRIPPILDQPFLGRQSVTPKLMTMLMMMIKMMRILMIMMTMMTMIDDNDPSLQYSISQRLFEEAVYDDDDDDDQNVDEKDVDDEIGDNDDSSPQYSISQRLFGEAVLGLSQVQPVTHQAISYHSLSYLVI